MTLAAPPRIPGLTPVEQCKALARLAADVPHDQVIVEIGVYKGRSACWLAAGAMAGSGAHVYGIDPWGLPGQDAYTELPRKEARFHNESNRARANAAIHRAGLRDHVTLIQGFSHQVAQRQWHETRPIGLLYIDGNHSGDHPYQDYLTWSTHMAADAVVAWDDYEAARFPDVVAAVDRLVAEGSVEKVDHVGRLIVTRRVP